MLFLVRNTGENIVRMVHNSSSPIRIPTFSRPKLNTGLSVRCSFFIRFSAVRVSLISFIVLGPPLYGSGYNKLGCMMHDLLLRQPFTGEAAGDSAVTHDNHPVTHVNDFR